MADKPSGRRGCVIKFALQQFVAVLLILPIQVLEYTSMRITTNATPVNATTIYSPPPINTTTVMETLQVLVTLLNTNILSAIFRDINFDLQEFPTNNVLNLMSQHVTMPITDYGSNSDHGYTK